jgi:predicted acylesterase/phospholipase RssA
MTNPNGRQQAVILSGGGADGAYEVGVVKALFSGQSPATGYRPLDPDIFTGNSVGSFNAAFLVSHWETDGPAAADGLQRVWLDVLSESPQTCGNGVYRLRANPLKLVDPACFIPNPLQPLTQFFGDSVFLTSNGFLRAIRFAGSQEEPLAQRFLELFNLSTFVSRQPLRPTLRNEISYEHIRLSKRVFKIVATNWVTGQYRIFTNEEMTEQLGPLAILASSAIPGFFNPTLIEGQSYVDGGVLMNTPLNPAIDAGADVLHVIYLDPDVKAIPVEVLQSTLDTLYRMLVIQWADAVNQDIEHALAINRGLEVIRQIARGAEVTDTDARDFLTTASKISRHLGSAPRYRQLTIHRYHPRDDLGGPLGLLNFERSRTQKLIARGFEDTVHHDCAASHCVLPNVVQPDREVNS